MSLTHLNSLGQARMVDVSAKLVTKRQAIAEGFVHMQAATMRAIIQGKLPKGEVLAVARIAGIQAAKRCGDLIPLCHPLPLESVEVAFEPPVKMTGKVARLRIVATAGLTGKTGVEMEALTAVAVAGLTIYDMCKSMDKSMTLSDIRLLEKTGGKSGTWRRKKEG